MFIVAVAIMLIKPYIKQILNDSFYPSGFHFETREQLIREALPYFYPHAKAAVTKTDWMPPTKEGSIKPIPRPSTDKREKNITLDFRYWAFWTVYIVFHGQEEFFKRNSAQQLNLWREERKHISKWYQENFFQAKKELAHYWDKLVSRDLEDAMSCLLINASDTEHGIRMVALYWVYYSHTIGPGTGRHLCWKNQNKRVYYDFIYGKNDDDVNTPIWEANVSDGKCVMYANCTGSEWKDNWIRMVAVNRGLELISKHDVAYWIELCRRVGIAPKEGEKWKKTDWFSHLQLHCIQGLCLM